MLVSAYNSLQWNNLSSAFLLFICSWIKKRQSLGAFLFFSL
jgi:hypothetical protein